MKILRTASLESNFTGSSKKTVYCNEIIKLSILTRPIKYDVWLGTCSGVFNGATWATRLWWQEETSETSALPTQIFE